MFKVGVKDSQCQHVLLGACGDVKYWTALQVHSHFHDKISCIKGTFLDTNIQNMTIKNVIFPQVFDTSSTYKLEHALVKTSKEIPPRILASGICLDFQQVSYGTCNFPRYLLTQNVG